MFLDGEERPRIERCLRCKAIVENLMKQVPKKEKEMESTIGRVGFGENDLFTPFLKWKEKWKRREKKKKKELIR